MKRGMDSFTCPGGRIEVDTTDFSRVDTEAIVAEVKKMLQ